MILHMVPGYPLQLTRRVRPEEVRQSISDVLVSLWTDRCIGRIARPRNEPQQRWTPPSIQKFTVILMPRDSYLDVRRFSHVTVASRLMDEVHVGDVSNEISDLTLTRTSRKPSRCPEFLRRFAIVEESSTSYRLDYALSWLSPHPAQTLLAVPSSKLSHTHVVVVVAGAVTSCHICNSN